MLNIHIAHITHSTGRASAWRGLRRPSVCMETRRFISSAKTTVLATSRSTARATRYFGTSSRVKLSGLCGETLFCPSSPLSQPDGTDVCCCYRCCPTTAGNPQCRTPSDRHDTVSRRQPALACRTFFLPSRAPAGTAIAVVAASGRRSLEGFVCAVLYTVRRCAAAVRRSSSSNVTDDSLSMFRTPASGGCRFPGP